MKIVLDTSALFKLYHQEAGTVQLEAVFTHANITQVFLSEIAKVEFASAIWKKVWS
jgi:predicted nucleic acid-binding protein